jgi:transposase InsO family protein
VNAKRVYHMMRVHDSLLHRRPARPRIERPHDGEVAVPKSNQRWCSDGFEFRCNNGEPLRVTFALDCCDREVRGQIQAPNTVDDDLRCLTLTLIPCLT